MRLSQWLRARGFLYPALPMLLAGVLLLAPNATAQTGQGTLTGTITDSTGAIIPGVSVSIINQANATLEIQNNLPITGGFLNNQGLLLKTGTPGPLSLTGTTFTNSGQVRLRLGTTSDTIVSDGHVQLDGGSLELVLQPGFDPPEGARKIVFAAATK